MKQNAGCVDDRPEGWYLAMTNPLHNLAGNLFGCRGRTSWLSTELVAEVLQVLPDVKGDDLLAVNSHKFLQQRMLQQLMYGGNISQFRRHRVDGPVEGSRCGILVPASIFDPRGQSIKCRGPT